MNKTEILWTEKTWNPMSGCRKVSAGCAHCYAEDLAENKRGTRAFPNGFDLTIRPHKLREPRSLRSPSLIFVNSMSDLFFEDVDDSYRDQILDVIESTPQHQYQVLTKRPERMLAYSRRRKLPSNFWAGVTVEHAKTRGRISRLRKVDAEIRFVSAEPLLGTMGLNLDGIAWLIGGGESGVHLMNPNIRQARSLCDYDARTRKWTPRPGRMDWVRRLRDDCLSQNVGFFFKQWGGCRPTSGGRELDGRTHDDFPRGFSFDAVNE